MPDGELERARRLANANGPHASTAPPTRGRVEDLVNRRLEPDVADALKGPGPDPAELGTFGDPSTPAEVRATVLELDPARLDPESDRYDADLDVELGGPVAQP